MFNVFATSTAARIMHIRQEFDMHLAQSLLLQFACVTDYTRSNLHHVDGEGYESAVTRLRAERNTHDIVVSQEDASLHMFLTITAVSLNCVEVDVRMCNTTIPIRSDIGRPPQLQCTIG